MCGRYILAQQAKFERELRLGRIDWSFSARYNVAPSQSVPVVRVSEGIHAGVMMRWGLIPFFAHGVPPRYATINASIERLQSAPAWRGPCERGQRCIQVAAGFYEWHLEANGREQPYFIHLTDHEVFGFPGLWDRSIAADGTVIDSCALVTVPANELLRDIHNTGAHPGRMPAILAPADFDLWLEGSAPQARAALRAYPARRMAAYRVSTRVNSPKTEGAELIEPARGDEPSALHLLRPVTLGSPPARCGRRGAPSTEPLVEQLAPPVHAEAATDGAQHERGAETHVCPDPPADRAEHYRADEGE